MKLALALAIGAVLGAIGMTVASDYAARAPGDEVARCTDDPDRAAYYARRPGEAHSVETCVRVPRYGDPAWVPVMGDVTVAGAGVRGKPGLEQQLGYVRDMCRKLARQLKQRC